MTHAILEPAASEPDAAARPAPKAKRAAKPAYEPAGFFVMRSPLLPRSALAPAAPVPPAGEREAWLTTQYAHAVTALRRLVRRPDIRDAIFLASPSLDEAIDSWLEGSAAPAAPDAAIRRYVQRMASRCTPFGLFAGVSVGTVGAATHLAIAERGALRRHTRIDARFLRAVADAIAADPALRDELVYVPTSTLYKTGGRLRYAESHGSPERRAYRLVAVEESEGVDLVLARAATGARAGELADALVTAFAPEVTHDDAAAFVDELIATQILVPRLAPALTGDEPVHALLAELATMPAAAAWHARLAAAQAAIAALDAAPLGEPRARYRAIFDQLHAITPAIADAHLLQVDLVKPGAAPVLGRDVLDDVLRALDAMHRMARSQAGALADFADRFRARYDDREVPLVDALDEENGIGFAANQAGVAASPPLLAGLLPFGPGTAGTRAWTERDDALLRRLEPLWRGGGRVLALSDDDIAALAAPRTLERPPGLAATLTVLGDHLFLRSAAAPSAATLLGRFCHADPALARWTRTLAEREQANEPDAILAEVVHQPQDVLGNVACRPVLRDYEIVYLGASGAPADRRIAVDDLLLCERDGQLILRSRRLGKRVIPRLASAHNWAVNGAAIYSFLCALQTDRNAAPFYQWDWGPLAASTFLPRVTIGRVIVAPARWRIDVAPLRAGKTVQARFDAVQALRNIRALPRHLRLVQADHELAVDLDDVLGVEAMLGALPPAGEALFIEQLADAEALVARGDDGGYDHELIVPLVRTQPTARPAIAASPARRSALPGSDWLYLKLYGGASTLERILVDAVAPVLPAEWFFIRYADPDWHLRLRLQGDAALLYGQVLPAVERALRPYHAGGALKRLALDTYEPELERYGGAPGMAVAESIFCADSRAMLGVLGRHAADRPERWQLALLGIHDLLDAFGYSLAARLAFTRTARDNFAREHRAGVATQKALGIRFRQARSAVEAMLDRSHADAALLDERRARLFELAADASSLAKPVDHLLSSYMHMWVNRAVHTAGREQEFVLFDLLARTYESRKARGA